HRPGRRHANAPVAGAAGIVLHTAVGAWLQYFDHRWLPAETGQPVGGNLAGGEERRVHDLAQVVEVGGDTGNAGGTQRLTHFADGVGTVMAVDDNLGQHRVEVGRHLGAGGGRAGDPRAIRDPQLGE